MKNRIVEIDSDTVGIVIYYKGKNLICYIDREDLMKVSQFKGTWHINRNRTGHIDGVKTKVQIDKVRKQYWIHNVIMNKSNPNNVIDHVDHNTLNNRKSNLREVTPIENAQNISTLLKSNTKHRNVTLEDGKYRVRIKGISFGRYNTLGEAIKIANAERKKLFPKSSDVNNKINI